MKLSRKAAKPKDIEAVDNKFSLRLRSSTQEVHTMAEQTGFIRGFLRGTASHESYLQLLTDLLPVYEEMESQLERLSNAGHAHLLPFHMPELYRVSSLKRDIDFIRDGLDGDAGAEVMPSIYSINYVNRVRYVAESEEPAALAGHLYTRYLGDLSGGQILARIARNAMGLDDGRGLEFYVFRKVDNVAEAKKRFRAALDHFDGDTNLEKLVTAEAIISFKHNIAIFNSLRGSSWRSLWRNLISLRREGATSLSHAEGVSN